MTDNLNNNKKSMRNVVLILMVLVALFLVVFGVKNGGGKAIVENNSEPVKLDENKNIIELCFAYIKVAGEPQNGFEDDYNLSMALDKEIVTGELNYLPAEKDKKTGIYEGTVSAVDQMTMTRTIDATWHTSGEGINADEPLKVVFGEGTATVDGLTLNDVDCNMLDERVAVKEYLKKNISLLAPKPASLGGTWFYLRSVVDTTQKTGYIVYEDGHNEEKRQFTYELKADGSVNSLKVI